MTLRVAAVVAPAALVGLLARGSPAPLATGELAGRISLVDAAAKESPAPDAVIWLPGVDAPNPLLHAPPTITQKDKRFDPHVLTVPRGTTVSFPNLDRIYHNVFSLTPGSRFDLGLYRGGESRDVTFETPGLVRVYCNIHPQMAAYVFVVDGAAFATAGAGGRYRIGGIPAGRRVVRVWHEKGKGREAEVEVRAGETVTLDMRLEASGYRDGPHKDKRGQDYPPLHEADRY